MNYKEAISIFISQHPALTVTRCLDYDHDHFVVEAVEDIKIPAYNSPYYGIDKRSGKITSFIPSFDLDAFFDAIDNRTVYHI